MAKTIWIIAGEASGDCYGAALAKELRLLRPDLQILGMGGEQMRSAGVEITEDSSELGIIGLFAVLKKLFFFIRLFFRLSRQIISSRPACAVLIDYPGFNLRLALRLHKAGIRIVWYISPQVWAWKKGRIPKLAAAVDRMLCIFPFEPAVYAGSGLRAEFVGHPLLEQLSELRHQPIKRDSNLVLLLPGSRTGELNDLLQPILQTAERLLTQRPDLHFIMPLQRQKSLEQVQEYLKKKPLTANLENALRITVGDARNWMRRASAGIAASGTVTVEAAILELPLVVTYKVHPFVWWAGRKLVHLKYITIANLVLDDVVYEEKLQDMAVPEQLGNALLRILPGGERHTEVTEKLQRVILQLGGEEPVSRKVAQIVCETGNLHSPSTH